MTAAFVDVGLWNTDVAGHISVDCDAINVVVGNTIIVFTRYEDNDTTVTITDTAGNTYTELTTTHVQQGTAGGRFTAHYCLDCLGHSTNVITASFGASKSYIRVAAFQWSGIESLVSHEVASSTGTSVTGAGLTATEAGVLIAGIGHYNSRQITLTNDLVNNRGFPITPSYSYSTDGDVINTGAGTFTAGFSVTVSTSFALISILFSSVAAGGATYTKGITGSITTTGLLAKQLFLGILLTSSLTLTSVLNRHASKNLLGSLSLSGSLNRALKRLLISSLTLSGLVKKKVSKLFSAAITGSSTLTAGLQFLQSIAGNITMSSILSTVTGITPAIVYHVKRLLYRMLGRR